MADITLCTAMASSIMIFFYSFQFACLTLHFLNPNRALLKLFCPTEVTHLKCCDQDFDLANLVEHVLQVHDGSQPDHSEPSISPI